MHEVSSVWNSDAAAKHVCTPNFFYSFKYVKFISRISREVLTCYISHLLYLCNRIDWTINLTIWALRATRPIWFIFCVLKPGQSHHHAQYTFACAPVLLSMAPWLHTLCAYNIGSRHCLHRHGNSRALIDTNQAPISYRSIWQYCHVASSTRRSYYTIAASSLCI